MLPLSLLALVLSALPSAFGDVSIVKPAAGIAIPAGAIAIAWEDGGNAPSLVDLTTYQIDLMAGGNTDANSVVITNIIPAGTPFTSANTAQGVVAANLGDSQTNAYYLRITSKAKEGGQMINFSHRFSISGMKGDWPPAIAAAVASPITDTVGRSTSNINQVKNNAAVNSVPPADAASFSVPYGEQTGTIRYAPMMKMPPISITKQDTAPLFPTSSVVIATTFLQPAEVLHGIVTTVTQSNTVTVSQRENTAAAATKPADDMQKFLNRWKD